MFVFFQIYNNNFIIKSDQLLFELFTSLLSMLIFLIIPKDNTGIK